MSATRNLFQLKLRSKFIVAFLAVGVITIIIVGYVGYSNAKTSLERESFNKLTSIREIKGAQIERYFHQIENQIITFSESQMVIDAMKEFKQHFHAIDQELSPDEAAMQTKDAKIQQYYQNEYLQRLMRNLGRPTVLADYWPEEKNTRILQDLYLASNLNPTGSKDELDDANDGSNYSKTHKKYHPIIRSYLKKFGYYDIFLVDPETGHIVYTVFKEVDYGTSLLTGPYRNTNFARAFKAAKEAAHKDFVELVDFEPYHPSYNAAASFIASPIYEGDEKIGVLLFQMPIDEINNIMTNNQKWSQVGLGESGETYIVGEDFKLRNQSRFLIEDPENYFKAIENTDLPQATLEQIKLTGNSIGLQTVQTQGTQAALNGESGKEIFPDYRKVPVLSSYRPLNIEGVRWVLMSEIDEAEALAPVDSLRNQMFLAGIVLLALTIVSGVLFSVLLTRPVQVMLGRLQDIAEGEGDLTQRIEVKSNDEVGQLGQAFNQFIEKLQKVIFQCQTTAQDMANQTGKILTSSQSLASGAATQASSMEEIGATVAEISSQSEQNTANVSQADHLMNTVQKNAETGGHHMKEMVQAMAQIDQTSQNISKIIKTIDEIAFQTNLLALNAAVEAARAGVHGKGFAVVANEVRNLAVRSASAARETTEMIEESLGRVTQGLNVARQTEQSFSTIVNDINQITDIVMEIETAIKEQNEGIGQVNQGISQTEQVIHQNTTISEENASASNILQELANNLDRLLLQFKTEQNLGVPVALEELPKASTDFPSNLPTLIHAPSSSKPQQIVLDDAEFGKF